MSEVKVAAQFTSSLNGGVALIVTRREGTGEDFLNTAAESPSWPHTLLSSRVFTRAADKISKHVQVRRRGTRRETEGSQTGLQRLTISIHRRREALRPHFPLYVPAASHFSSSVCRRPCLLAHVCISTHVRVWVGSLSEDKESFSAALVLEINRGRFKVGLFFFSLPLFFYDDGLLTFRAVQSSRSHGKGGRGGVNVSTVCSA